MKCYGIIQSTIARLFSRMRFFFFRLQRKRFLKTEVFKPDGFHNKMLLLAYGFLAFIIASIIVLIGFTIAYGILGLIFLPIYFFVETEASFPTEVVATLVPFSHPY